MRYLNALFEVLIPLRGTHLAGVGKTTVFIDDLGFNDVEDLLRVDVTALRACTLRLVSSIDNRAGVDDGFHGSAIVNLTATRIEDDQRVEHLEDIRRWLMDHHKDHLSPQ